MKSAPAPHAVPASEVLAGLDTGPSGLSPAEAAARLARLGPNTLPSEPPVGLLVLFIRQFKSPLIYVLLLAAIVSLALGELADGLFVFFALLLNAIIGFIQERSAQRSAEALKSLVVAHATVRRAGEDAEIAAQDLVLGDLVLLESGAKVPADLRLVRASGLEVDESLLTGESLTVDKRPDVVLTEDAPLGDRRNMVFAGTLVTRGRAEGVVVATAFDTQLGRIAADVLGAESGEPPLLQRMARFTSRVAIAVAVMVSLLGTLSLLQGATLHEVFILGVALAVCAVPEGLPVSITVALALGMSRMSRRNVVVRRLVAVESLGSCTFIATDKTGTLTLNALTVQRVVAPGERPWEVTGGGQVPEGGVQWPDDLDPAAAASLAGRIAEAGALCNEATLARKDGAWTQHGDAVDVALLVYAHKLGLTRGALEAAHPPLAALPFESERLFAASVHRVAGQPVAFVKGALERVLPMCTTMATRHGDAPLDAATLEAQARALAADGYRVLALASGPVPALAGETPPHLTADHLSDLTLVGLVGMIDPLRPEAPAAIEACRRAGIEVAMVTGDHPLTALAIARSLGLADTAEQVVTGPQLAEAAARSDAERDALVRRARVFARVSPRDKLEIVQALTRLGHFVAVTGDGANDAPALRAAHVGVAMGLRGTDVARETADLIISDDDFSSIVSGIEEGRVSYANVRKVIFLLISCGAAELILFTLAMAFGQPLPFTAVQLLWLNLVTNGIQDVALAYEPAEGDELRRRPRSPGEAIFDRSMIERVLLSALVMGAVTFAVFVTLLDAGWGLESARNSALLTLVLFQNVLVGSARSETRSAFALSPLRNRVLLIGTATAQLIHLGAMVTPGVRDVLGLQPVSLTHWLTLFGLSLTVLAAMELYKFVRRPAPRPVGGERLATEAGARS